MFLRLFVVCVFGMSVFATPVLAVDIDCKNALETCPPPADPCGCKSNPPSPVEIEGPAVATKGSVFGVKSGTGRAAYHFSIDAGSIDQLTGEVTSAPECPQTATVTATDACGQQDSMTVELNPAQLGISGPEDVVVGSSFGVSGGAAPYIWSFGGGSMDDTGQITAINDCSGPGTVRSAVITVTDSCSQSANLDVRLPGGRWEIIGELLPSYRTNHFYTQNIAGSTRTTAYYVQVGSLASKPDYSINQNCLASGRTDNINGGTYVFCATAICGAVPSLPSRWSAPGYAGYYRFNDYPCMPSPYRGNYVIYDSWYTYGISQDYYKTEVWQCP